VNAQQERIVSYNKSLAQTGQTKLLLTHFQLYTSLVLHKQNYTLKTYTECSAWPPFTAHIKADHFQKCPTALSTKSKRS